MRSLLAALAVLAAAALALTLGPATDRTAAAKPPEPVRGAIARAAGAAQITPEAAAGYRSDYAKAQAALGHLDGLRKRELRSVVSIVRGIARRGALTSVRMPVVFLTLRRNTEWWSLNGPPAALSPGEQGAMGRVCKPFKVRAKASRLQFPGSGIVWQYYPGLGLQLQVLATFSGAQAQLSRNDDRGNVAALQTLDEMAPLASQRAGQTTWEYLFPFGGGVPPWTSAISQAAAIRVLAQTGQRMGRPDLIALAQKAVGLFATPPPQGVEVRLEKDGSWFALYSFAPGQRVLNAHLESLVGLHDYAEVTKDARAQRLYREGLRAARRRIGSFDTGRWSKYSNPGAEADLNYHVLNRDEARAVCKRSGEKAICRAASSFGKELDEHCPKVATPARKPL